MPYLITDFEDRIVDHGPTQWDLVAPSMAEAHAQWHQIHKANALCPLDCGVGEYDDQPSAEQPTLVRCGHCGGRHTVAGVRACAVAHTSRARDETGDRR